jgi:transcriptional regulator with XRE-family HTH domain
MARHSTVLDYSAARDALRPVSDSCAGQSEDRSCRMHRFQESGFAEQMASWELIKPSPLSQKQLAAILRITSRHLRRLENMLTANNIPCERPYSVCDLFRIFRVRSGRGWDREFAARVGVDELFDRFETLLQPERVIGQDTEWLSIALASMAADDRDSLPVPDARSVPVSIRQSLKEVMKMQLRAILLNRRSREILLGAFLEATLALEAGACEVRQHASAVPGCGGGGKEFDQL